MSETPPENTHEPRPGEDASLWLGGAIVLLVLFVFAQTLRHDFIPFDDPEYVINNPTISQGLTLDGLTWSLTAVVANMWHPLTLVSHMVDVQLFGLNPGPHHLVSVALHAINSLLVFLLLRQMTGSVWKSAVVAALFAVHPLRVESVAWVSERKDVLSALFWLLTTMAYVRYTRGPSVFRYAITIVLFALGLLAKPMLVSLPFTLLLLDVWPLKRIEGVAAGTSARPLRALVVEKLPLFALAVAASVVAVWSQAATNAIGNVESYPLFARLANGAVAYVAYLRMTFLPVDLAVHYPYFGRSIPLVTVLLCGALLIAITVGALFAWRRYPYVFVGWFWFAGVLVPVSGLVQVGSASHADRYTYIPHLGLLTAIVWLIGHFVEDRRVLRRPALLAAGGVILVLAGLAYVQTARWRNTVTLFEHTVRVSPTSAIAHMNLGIGYAMAGQPELAEPEFRQAVALNPLDAEMRKNLGAALLDQGKAEEAEEWFRSVIELAPYDPEAHVNLAIALYHQGKYAESTYRAKEALRIDPGYERAQRLIDANRRAIPPEPLL